MIASARPRGRVGILGWLLGGAISLTAVAIVAVWLLARPPAIEIVGTPLNGRASPDFRLTDHRGVEFTLSSFRGRPVLLTFLFANCPDVCRLTAAGLKQALEHMDDRASAVQLVAVTVDPDGDDPSTVRRFLSRYALAERMVYLTGPREALPSVWRDYFLYVSADPAQPPTGLDGHTDAIYLIDGEGRQRSFLRSDFDPVELSAALAELVAEGE